MNRFAALGLAIDAHRGRSIVVVTHGHEHAALDEILRAADGLEVSLVCRANGRHRIDFASGGSIELRYQGLEMRGMDVQTVYLDEGVAWGWPDTLIDDVREMVRAHADGEVIRT
ncbi:MULTISPECIES: hypothetical protein [unclassified Agrococcus]|uniref:hypothetical protein n=1 Tax=unclassified Agrococcus TaxID=2615065 RepID=UPI003605C058